jgi:adenylyltransferase and sulfurtransferase
LEKQKLRDMTSRGADIMSLEAQIRLQREQLSRLETRLSQLRQPEFAPQDRLDPSPAQESGNTDSNSRPAPPRDAHDAAAATAAAPLQPSSTHDGTHNNPMHALSPSARPLSNAEFKRYGRQLIMPEIGLAGQIRLKSAAVLIVGLGGLGCPAAAYLAGAGVGRIGLVDGDVVEESNLHRQVLHSTPKMGWSKVDSALEFLLQYVSVCLLGIVPLRCITAVSQMKKLIHNYTDSFTKSESTSFNNPIQHKTRP